MKLEKRGEVSAEEAAAAEAAQETVQAEQTAGRKKPVLLYLVILFAIALFLILFSFLAQNRVNAMEMQEMQAEVDAARELQVKYEQSQAENASLRTQLEEANALAAEESRVRQALELVWQLERYYVSGDNEPAAPCWNSCAQTISTWPSPQRARARARATSNPPGPPMTASPQNWTAARPEPRASLRKQKIILIQRCTNNAGYEICPRTSGRGKGNIKKKFQDQKLPLVDEIIALDAENRAAITEASELRAQRNQLSKQVGMLMGQAKKDPSKLEEAEAVKAQVKANADRLAELEQKETELEQKIHKIMLQIPQIIDPSVPSARTTAPMWKCSASANPWCPILKFLITPRSWSPSTASIWTPPAAFPATASTISWGTSPGSTRRCWPTPGTS